MDRPGLQSVSRRRVVVAFGSAAASGFGGCLGADESVGVLAAGSLAATFEHHVGPAFDAETGIALHAEYLGSNAVMGMVESRTKPPDVEVSADATLIRNRTFATDEENYVAEGRPILYDATVVEEADAPAAGHRLVQFLATHPDLLVEAGLVVPDGSPRASGAPPKGVSI